MLFFMSPLVRAIGVGVGVFAIMMLLFWGIARLAGRPFLALPQRAAPTPLPTPSPSALPFL